MCSRIELTGTYIYVRFNGEYKQSLINSRPLKPRKTPNSPISIRRNNVEKPQRGARPESLLRQQPSQICVQTRNWKETTRGPAEVRRGREGGTQAASGAEMAAEMTAEMACCMAKCGTRRSTLALSKRAVQQMRSGAFSVLTSFAREFQSSSSSISRL